MSACYIAAPFTPWWDEAETGPAPLCERCGAMMVRFPTPTDAMPQKTPPLGWRPGWKCLSCDNYRADDGAKEPTR
jgi:hypothetical protein